MPKLDDIAAILWIKWGTTFLETLHQEASEAADGLAFRAMNTQGGVRTLLVVCTVDPARIKAVEEAAAPGAVVHPVDWENYSAAEMVIKTEKKGGFGHQERRDGSGRTALVLCATRPASVRTIERLCDLPE